MGFAEIIITRRLKLPKHLMLAKGVRVFLNLKHVERKHDAGVTDIEVSFKFELSGKPDKKFDIETVIPNGEIREPARNPKSWERVRQLILEGYSPEDAWMQIAFELTARHWKMSLGPDPDQGDDEGDEAYFLIRRNTIENNDMMAPVGHTDLNHFVILRKSQKVVSSTKARPAVQPNS